nr:hypothetical protein Iba_chr01aCG0700 [Ipomoea batatas]
MLNIVAMRKQLVSLNNSDSDRYSDSGSRSYSKFNAKVKGQGSFSNNLNLNTNLSVSIYLYKEEAAEESSAELFNTLFVSLSVRENGDARLEVEWVEEGNLKEVSARRRTRTK